MADIKTTYMGLPLKNPLIVSSSPLTGDLDKIKKCAEAGAGAVVLKSLFEEQIDIDSQKMLAGASDMGYADGAAFLENVSRSQAMDSYLTLVEEVKKCVDIPIIASVNSVSAGAWIDYAKRFVAVGADALEINAFVIPSDVNKTARDYEKIYLDIISRLKKEISIPISMKISSHFTDLAGFISRLCQKKLDAVVLFNRFYRPDVDTEKMVLKHGQIISSPTGMALPLQWIALLSGEIDFDFASSTGVFTGNDAVKQLLVGARAVQVCSTLMKNGIDHLSVMLKDIEEWMEKKGFARVADFNGVLCQEASKNPELYERSQYIKGIVGIG